MRIKVEPRIEPQKPLKGLYVRLRDGARVPLEQEQDWLWSGDIPEDEARGRIDLEYEY